MTLKRLMIILAILVFLAGVGIAWLWQYAYSPQGRARVIIAQLKNDNTSLRGWMLKHQIIRQGFQEPPLNPDGSEPPRNYNAAIEISKLGPKTLPPVIEALSDSNPRVQFMAVWVCGRLRDPAAIGPLANCVRDTITCMKNDGPFQDWCIDSMVKIGPDAYGPLMEAAKAGPDVRSGIPCSLEFNWGQASVPYLVKLLEDPDMNVRANAELSLGRLKNKDATDALVNHINDPNSAAAEALGYIGDTKAIPALFKTIRNNSDREGISYGAAGAMSRMDRGTCLEYLRAKSKSRDPKDRVAVAMALYNFGKDAFELLQTLTEDADSNVSLKAIEVWGAHVSDDPRAIPALKRIAAGHNSKAEAAARILKRIMEPPNTQTP